jgi:hypothetical protein
LRSRSIGGKIFRRHLQCIDLATRIATKRAAGRIKNLDAIAELEALQEERKGKDTGSAGG